MASLILSLRQNPCPADGRDAPRATLLWIVYKSPTRTGGSRTAAVGSGIAAYAGTSCSPTCGPLFHRYDPHGEGIDPDLICPGIRHRPVGKGGGRTLTRARIEDQYAIATSARKSMAYPVFFLVTSRTAHFVSTWASDGTICWWLARTNWEAPYWNLWQLWFTNNDGERPEPGDGPYYFWWYGHWQIGP